MAWLELRIDSSPERAPDYEQALLAAGALSVTLQDNADQPIFEPALGETPLWQHTCVTGLFNADINSTSIVDSLDLNAKEVSFHWHILEDKDWEREWIKHFAPLQCNHNLWVCPSWIEPPEPEAINLLLDPGLAFGTGTHPTTYLCLNWLAEQSLDNCDIMDYGCGSGILGLAALLLGADTATGVDIDPQALIATQENAKRNAIDAKRFPVFLPHQHNAQHHDIVLANILAGPLVELNTTISALVKPGGLLCLSGIIEQQADTVKQAYAPLFDFEPTRVKDGWVGLYAKKRTV